MRCRYFHRFHPLHRHLVVTFWLVGESTITFVEAWEYENACDDYDSYEVVLTQRNYRHRRCSMVHQGCHHSPCVLSGKHGFVFGLHASSPGIQPSLSFCSRLKLVVGPSCEVAALYPPILSLSEAAEGWQSLGECSALSVVWRFLAAWCNCFCRGQ